MTTILVIEDDDHIRANIVETLTLEGYASLEAENGRIGVHIAKTHLPNLILCDIMMPELDGYSVLLQLRENPATATIPFIFLTSQVEKSSMRQAMIFGADDYLTKPFVPFEVIAAVNSRLERHALTLQARERQLDELRGNLLLALPHELRTPLTSIIGYSDYILNFKSNMNAQEMIPLIGNINKAGYRLLRMIENYLVYAQLEIIQSDPKRIQEFQGKTVEQPAEVITKTVTQKANQTGRGADIKLTLEAAPIYISTDSLQKIMEEIIDNALKFSTNGTPIEVSATLTPTEYRILIKDQGIGMTSEQISRVGAYMQFERKLHEQQGAGLGLIIAKRLVELYGGTFTIDSVYGQQTNVMIGCIRKWGRS